MGLSFLDRGKKEHCCWLTTVCICREKALGLNDPQVAESLSHVGQLLQRLGRCAEAEPILRRAVKIEQEQFGDTHLQACDYSWRRRSWKRPVSGNSQAWHMTLQVAKSLSNLASLLNDTAGRKVAEQLGFSAE